MAIGQNKYKHSVYFDTDASLITNSETEKLNCFLDKLDSLYISKISIYGFCDDRGTDKYNLNLSKKRAIIIKQTCTVLFDKRISRNSWAEPL